MAIVIMAALYVRTLPGPDMCIIVNPQEVVGGSISNYRGLLLTGPDRYTLGYKGKFRRTGNECTTSFRVTKEEYERQMYGIE